MEICVNCNAMQMCVTCDCRGIETNNSQYWLSFRPHHFHSLTLTYAAIARERCDDLRRIDRWLMIMHYIQIVYFDLIALP